MKLMNLRANIKRLRVIFIIFIVCGLISVICWLLSSQKPAVISGMAPASITPAESKADIDFLLNQIKKINPEPFRNCSELEVNSLAATIKNKLNHTIRPLIFYRIIRPLVSSFNDPHLSIIYSDLYIEKLQKKHAKLFPFQIAIDGDRIFIKKNLSNNSVTQKGWEIISINGIPSRKLLETLVTFCSGSTRGYKTEAIEANFQLYLWKAYGFEGPYHIEMKDRQAFTSEGISINALDSINAKKQYFEFKILDTTAKSVAIIKILSLEIDKKVAFEAFLSASFSEIKKNNIENLIIDIRNNPGGSTLLAKECFNYITDKPYSVSKEEIFLEDGKLKKERYETLSTPTPVPDKFKGNVVLLINALTGSSAHMMATTFSYYKFGKIVGDISSVTKHISGEVSQFTLPNSKLIVYCPTSSFILPYFSNPNESIVPDYLYKETLNDKLSGTDRQLEYCLKIIENNAVIQNK